MFQSREIASIVFLGLGLGLLFGYCHDSTVSFSGAYPVAGATLDIVFHTNGLPAMVGLVSTIAGILFLFAALAFTVLKLVSHRTVGHSESAPVGWPGFMRVDTFRYVT